MNCKVFDCLSAETSIKGQKLLEASAGTGKTFAIEHIAVRLILEGISIDEILIVTFTNLATNELKERILSNLNKCYFLLKEKKIEEAFPYLNKYFDSSDALEKAIISIQNAISFFDDAQIFTIHSFCKRSLQEFSFETNLTLSFTGSDSHSDKNILKDKIKKIFLNPLFKQQFFSSSFHFFLKNKKIDILINKVIEVVNNGLDIDQSKPFSIKDLLETIKYEFEKRGFVQLDLSSLQQDFSANSQNYKRTKFSKTDFASQIELLSEISFNFFNMEAWDRLLFHEFSIGKFFTKENSKVKPVEIQNENYPSFFSFLGEVIHPKISILFDSKYFLNTLIHSFKEDLTVQIEKADSFSADRLLEMMEKALKNKSFQNSIKKKYKAAIIDEFQDTDKTQWNIFLRAFLSEPKIPFFYLVGDPKQSIYAFRNADIYTYLKAVSYLGKENIYLLDTNYRSSKELVSGLNALFNRKWLHLPKTKEVLNYHPVKAVHDRVSDKAPIHYMIAEEKNCFDVESEMFFPFIYDEIVRNSGPYSKYAILVKDRFQEQKLQNFLFLRNIPCASRKKAICETSAYICLKQLMQAILDPSDMSNLKLLMVSLNYSFEDLKDDEKITYFLVVFNQLHALFKKGGIENCLSQLIDIDFHGYFLLERLTQKDANSGSDFTDAMNILLEFSSKNYISENSLGAFWRSVEKDQQLRNSFEDEDSVQILTIHKSKGLEFDTVFCLGIAFSSSSSVLQTQAEEEIEAEKLRQLYVALTRAKSTLYIPIILPKKAKKSSSAVDLFLQNAISSSNVIDVPFIKNLLQEIHASNLFEVTVLQKQEKEKLKNNHSSCENFLKSYPDQKAGSLFLSFTAVSKPFAIKKNIQECESFPVGAESGVIIHKILEDLFSKRKDQSKKIDVKRYTRDTLLEGYEEEIENIIHRVLSIELSPFSFTLSDVDPSKFITELEFCYLQGRNKMKGFIDLIFYHQEKYFVIDWKTNFLGNDISHEALKEEMRQHDYFLQGSIYANALKKSLKLFDSRPFEECFGGVFFIFVRGIKENNRGVFHIPISESLK